MDFRHISAGVVLVVLEPNELQARADVSRRGAVSLLLVAEDRSSLRDILAIFLTSEGFSVRTAKDGGEVIDLLEAGALPELLIVDLKMPVRDGIEVVRYVRARPMYDGLPILILTGSVGAPALAAGEVQAVLSKPFDLQDLLTHVRSLVVP